VLSNDNLFSILAVLVGNEDAFAKAGGTFSVLSNGNLFSILVVLVGKEDELAPMLFVGAF
jgi:hypothetical protein